MRYSALRNRVARGSGLSTTEVNRLITMLEKQHEMAKRAMSLNPETLEKMAQGNMDQSKMLEKAKKGGKGGFRI